MTKDRPLVCSVCPKDCFGSCSIEVEVDKGRVTKVRGNRKSPATGGRICSKGKNYINLLYSSKRLLYPLKRVGDRGRGEFERISWKIALDEISEKLKSIKEKHGPKSVLYYSRFGNLGVMKNCAYGFWHQYGGFTSTYGGLCDSAAQEAIILTYGEVKYNHISDLKNAKLIILWGMNPAYTNIHMMHYLNEAIDTGTKLVTIDVRENESGKNSDLYLYPRPGTDGCLALGIANQLIENNIINMDFIDHHTFGFEEFKELVKGYPLNKVFEITGVPISKIKKVVNLIKETPEYSIICGMGVQRYTNGGQTIRAISLLPALTGSIGKKGCSFYFSDKQAPELNWPFMPKKLGRIRNSIPIARLASELGNQINPPVKAMWVDQANPMTSNPNINSLAKAMNRLELIVVTDLFLTDTARMADIVFPVTSMFEYNDLISGYGHSYLQLQQKIIEPPGECKHACEIYRLLAEKFGFNLKYLPENNLATIEKIISSSYLTTNGDELKEKPYLPDNYQRIAFSDLKFNTSTRKIEFYCRKVLEKWGKEPLPVYHESVENQHTAPETYSKYPLTLISIHSNDKMNSQFSDLSAYEETPYIYINPSDASERGIDNGEEVKVYNERSNLILKAVLTKKVQRGITYIDFGWWDSIHKVSTNKLTGDYESDIGNGTAFHNCLVEIQKST